MRAALTASSFNWSLVRVQITIHIARDIPSSQATPGQIWLDAGLLDSGEFAWAFVQHEYAHQLDFFLLDDARGERSSRRYAGRTGSTTVRCRTRPTVARGSPPPSPGPTGNRPRTRLRRAAQATSQPGCRQRSFVRSSPRFFRRRRQVRCRFAN